MKQGNRQVRAALSLLGALAVFCSGASVWAQDEPDYIPTEAANSESKAEGEEGWDLTLTIGATVNFNQNDAVIGQPDGSTWTLGGRLQFGADYFEGGHEVRNNLDVSNTWTRTPVVSEFVRSNDTVRLESIYYYHLDSISWLGPFARFQLQTSAFKGTDVQPEESEYQITRLDGSVETVTADRLSLTSSLEPLVLKESFGGFARPIASKAVSLEMRLGLGAQEIFAKGALSIDDDEDTPQIEVIELDDSFQAGAEFVATFGGELLSKRLTYKAGVDVLVPFINSGDDIGDRGPVDLANIDFFARASVKIVSWASLDYEFRALRQPLLLDEFQVQNNLLLTFGYTLLGSDQE
jgi:hypothetical protein